MVLLNFLFLLYNCFLICFRKKVNPQLHWIWISVQSIGITQKFLVNFLFSFDRKLFLICISKKINPKLQSQYLFHPTKSFVCPCTQIGQILMIHFHSPRYHDVDDVLKIILSLNYQFHNNMQELKFFFLILLCVWGTECFLLNSSYFHCFFFGTFFLLFSHVTTSSKQVFCTWQIH